MVCCGNADMRGIQASKSTAAAEDPTKNNSKNTIDERNTLVNRTWVLPLGMLLRHLFLFFHIISSSFQ
jgi:hypothetical protein